MVMRFITPRPIIGMTRNLVVVFDGALSAVRTFLDYVDGEDLEGGSRDTLSFKYKPDKKEAK